MPLPPPRTLGELAQRFALRADVLRARAEVAELKGATDAATTLGREAWAWHHVAGRVAAMSERRVRAWLVGHLSARVGDPAVGHCYAEMRDALTAYLADAAAQARGDRQPRAAPPGDHRASEVRE